MLSFGTWPQESHGLYDLTSIRQMYELLPLNEREGNEFKLVKLSRTRRMILESEPRNMWKPRPTALHQLFKKRHFRHRDEIERASHSLHCPLKLIITIHIAKINECSNRESTFPFAKISIPIFERSISMQAQRPLYARKPIKSGTVLDTSFRALKIRSWYTQETLSAKSSRQGTKRRLERLRVGSNAEELQPCHQNTGRT